MSQLDDLKAVQDATAAELAKQTAINAEAVALLHQMKAALDAVVQSPDLSAAIASAQGALDTMAANDRLLADEVTADTPPAAILVSGP